jgi:hypothetical protein
MDHAARVMLPLGHSLRKKPFVPLPAMALRDSTH